MAYFNPATNQILSSKKYELAIIPPLQIIGNLIMNNRPKLNKFTYLVEHPKIEEKFLIPTKIPEAFLHPKEKRMPRLDVELILDRESKQDLISIYGTDYAKAHSMDCDYCSGYGVWPDSDTPLHEDEVTWCCADPCRFCGSHNHFEYEEMCGATRRDDSSEWSSLVVRSKGFYKAIDNMRNKICVES